jgi:hypothetical protein
MRSFILSLALLGPAHSAWASPEAAPAEAKEGFSLIHVDELAKLMRSGKIQIYDANGADFRSTNGVIPGAMMLASLRIDAAKVLPADKSTPLVFYCANSH